MRMCRQMWISASLKTGWHLLACRTTCKQRWQVQQGMRATMRLLGCGQPGGGRSLLINIDHNKICCKRRTGPSLGHRMMGQGMLDSLMPPRVWVFDLQGLSCCACSHSSKSQSTLLLGQGSLLCYQNCKFFQWRFARSHLYYRTPQERCLSAAVTLCCSATFGVCLQCSQAFDWDADLSPGFPCFAAWYLHSELLC